MAVNWWRYVSTGVGLSRKTSHQGASPPDTVSSTNKPESDTSDQDPASSPNKLETNYNFNRDIITPLNNEPVNPSVKIPRRMVVSSGKCLVKFCTCPHGRFVYGTGVGDPICIENDNKGGCRHKLSEHAESMSEGESEETESQLVLQSQSKSLLLEDPTLCPRSDTVASLWSRLCDLRVVHCRGTPTSGKTCLSRLLQRYVTAIPNMIVLYISWPGNPEERLDQDFDYLVQHFSRTTLKRPVLDYSNLLIICDEAQNSYSFLSFWNDLIKFQSQGAKAGPYIALFSSWGSPSASAVTYDGSAPPYLSTDQRVSLSTLYFTRQEFEDVVHRVCNTDELQSQPFLPSSDLVDYLFKITSGHPGCTRAILEVLIHSDQLRPYRKNHRLIDIESARAVIDDNDLLFSTIKSQAGFARSLPNLDRLQNDGDTVLVLRQAVLWQRVLGPLRENSGLEVAYKRGWLHAELPLSGRITSTEPQYIFPTEVHRRYCQHLLVPLKSEFPRDLFNDLVTVFCFAVIKRFSARCLSNSAVDLASGGVTRPLEAIYQDEFYRGSYEVLGSKSCLVSEWSYNRKGRIDFYVSGAKWGIECVRDSDRLGEHIARFQQPKGLYCQWDLSQHIILNFRTSIPTTYEDYPQLYHVVLTQEFTSCEILDYRGQIAEKFEIFQ